MLSTNTFKHLLITLKSMMLILCLLGINSAYAVAQFTGPAQQGQLDLSSWNFSQQGITKLDGEWAYFPRQLITELPPSATHFVKLPNTWGSEAGSEQLAKGYGYASYGLRIHLPDSDKSLGLRLKTASSALRLYIDGQLVASAGTVTTSPTNFTPQYKPSIITLPVNQQMDIVLQVANFHSSRGGAWNSIQIGLVDELHKERTQQVNIAVMLASMAFIIGIYHLVLWTIRKRDYAPLMFATLCLAVGARTFTVDELYILTLVEDLGFDALKRIEFSSMLIIYMGNWLFFHYVYPNEFKKEIVIPNIAPVALYLLIVLFTPVATFTWFLTWFHVVVLIGLLIGWPCLFRAIKNQRIGAKEFAIAMILLTLSVLHDINAASGSELRQSVSFYLGIQLLPIGYLIILITQAMIMARQSASTVTKLELRTTELAEANESLDQQADSLERTVIERTAELSLANKKLSELAKLDGLTGLANRREFNEQLKQHWTQHIHQHQSFSLIMVDVDYFKRYNDIHGHVAGDDTLVLVAHTLHTIMQASGALTARYGGEEFAIILPNTDSDKAVDIAEQVRKAIADLAHPYPEVPAEILTVSVGVATMQASKVQTATELVKQADQYLYDAKAAGRNCVVSKNGVI